jgi:hypothetical protein
MEIKMRILIPNEKTREVSFSNQNRIIIDAPPTPQRTQMWAQVVAEEGVGARSLAHNT